jgi:hypothetical protein
MIIYNVTSQVAGEIADKWLEWMKEEHIPEVVATGCFTHHRILRLLDTDESEGITFAVQYFCPNRKSYDLYVDGAAAELREKVLKKWGGNVISFRTLMEVIN